MSKQRPPKTNQPAFSTDRLIVVGERRTEADWDTYISILLAHALRKVGADLDDLGEPDD